MTETASETGSWRELLSRYLGTSIVLAGGVALYATNEFLTISLLPSTIADIGGSRLYAWVTTLYLVGSVVAATTVNTMLLRVGARSSYLMGLAVFGLASLVCAAAPSMQILVAGRTLQGIAGGLLAGLGYALINSTLPKSLWTRGSALVSAMWGRDADRTGDRRPFRAARAVAMGVRRDDVADRVDGHVGAGRARCRAGRPGRRDAGGQHTRCRCGRYC